MPGLQPGRALSQGSWAQALPNQGLRTKAPFSNHLWDPASPQIGAPPGLRDSASPLQHPQTGTPGPRAPKPGLLQNLSFRSPSKPELKNSALSSSVTVPTPIPLPKPGL